MSYDELADLYALQYEDYSGDLDFYARLASRHGGPVLELGAGQGRVAAHLARRGTEVWALEPSAAMRRRGEASTRGLPVRWIAGDMRDFELNRHFPLVIAPFNALMHLYTLTDQNATLERVASHLNTGGVFAFDLYNPLQIKADGALRLEGRYGRIEVYYRQEHHPASQRLTTYYVIDEAGPDGVLKRRHNRLDQRYFTRYEIERWLAGAGLVGRVAGGFQGQPFSEKSPLMAWTARRVS